MFASQDNAFSSAIVLDRLLGQTELLSNFSCDFEGGAVLLLQQPSSWLGLKKKERTKEKAIELRRRKKSYDEYCGRVSKQVWKIK